MIFPILLFKSLKEVARQNIAIISLAVVITKFPLKLLSFISIHLFTDDRIEYIVIITDVLVTGLVYAAVFSSRTAAHRAVHPVIGLYDCHGFRRIGAKRIVADTLLPPQIPQELTGEIDAHEPDQYPEQHFTPGNGAAG